MKEVLKKYNTDDVFLRNLILAVLNLLNSTKFSINSIFKDKENEYRVPFLYDLTGDERFMQDLFQNQTVNELLDDIIAEGNYEVVPRGVLTISNVSIDESELTSRFIRGLHQKIQDSQIKMYSSHINFVPLSISMEIEIISDTKINNWKMLQKFWDIFFRVRKVHFLQSGIHCEAYIGFPVDPESKKPDEISFGTEPEKRLIIPLEIATYYPIIDESTTFSMKEQILEFFINFNYDDANSVDRSGYFSIDELNTLNKKTNNSNIDALNQANLDNNIHKVDRFGKPTTKITDK